MIYTPAYMSALRHNPAELLEGTRVGALTLLKNAYPQFQPRSASELLAVVVANKNAPVSPRLREGVVE